MSAFGTKRTHWCEHLLWRRASAETRLNTKKQDRNRRSDPSQYQTAKPSADANGFVSHTCRAKDDIARAVGKQVKEGSDILPDQVSIARSSAPPAWRSDVCPALDFICVDGDDGAKLAELGVG